MGLPDKNLLANETSPYLLQHKNNPVHWRAWSREALDEARALDKPIFLSIGYAACHWCHVMEHECFEDPVVAEAMNRQFINIKVDREERPDIDQIYMTALQAMGDQGGWPLTMFLTPDARPFFGGTYFPKSAKYGRPGLLEIMKAVETAWLAERSSIDDTAHAVTAHVAGLLAPENRDQISIALKLNAYATKIGNSFDARLGGQSGAPKFPNAPAMQVLWLNWLENSVGKHYDAVRTTLAHNLNGGIYDHVGGGLARYSTDAEWMVPHFEKMLYDNAQMISLCCQVYSRTADPLLATRIAEIIEWMVRDLRSEDGAFVSSFDADSEGEEGTFYLWDRDEIGTVLGDDATGFFNEYDLHIASEFKGRGILYRKNASLEHAANDRLDGMLEQLRAYRSQRIPPARDDKVLTDWNGIAISAIAEAARLFGRADWLEIAETAFTSITKTMEDKRLPHSRLGAARKFPGLLSDYAAMILAATSLYQANRDARLLKIAHEWASIVDQWYLDETKDGYYLTSSDSNDVPMRIRGDMDEAIPSAMGQLLLALSRLATLSGDDPRYDAVTRSAEAALKRISGQSFGQAGIVYGAHIALAQHRLVMNDPKMVLSPVADRFIDPRRVDLVLHPQAIGSRALGDVTLKPDVPAAWLCIGQSCLAPVETAEALEQQLRG